MATLSPILESPWAGACSGLEWTVTPGTSYEERLELLATYHEAAHVELHRVTTWGTLVSVVNSLRRHDPGQYDAVHKWLVEFSRRVQEAYATYTSITVVCQGDTSSLAEYEDYRSAYDQARRLGPPLAAGSHIKLHAVQLALRACMQSTVLSRLVEHGLSKFRLTDVREYEKPNNRLQYLTLTHAVRWDHALRELEQLVQSWEAWDSIQAFEADPSVGHPYSPDADQLWSAIDEHLYSATADALESGGFPTKGLDDVVIETNQVLQELYSLHPEAQRTLRGAADRTDDSRSVNVQLMDILEDERIVLRSKPMPVVMQAKDTDPWRSVTALSSTGKKYPHLFVVARAAGRLREQHGLGSLTVGWLPDRPAEPVVTLRNSGPDERVRLLPITEPGDLSAVAEAARSRGFRVVSSLSLACLAERHWRERWLPAFQASTEITVLLDQPPSVRMLDWCHGGERIRFARAAFASHGCRWQTVCLRIGEDDEPIIAFGTLLMVSIMNDLLSDECAQAYTPATSWLDDFSERLRIATDHIIGEESFVDFWSP